MKKYIKKQILEAIESEKFEILVLQTKDKHFYQEGKELKDME